MKIKAVPAFLALTSSLCLTTPATAQVSILFDYSFDTQGFFTGGNAFRQTFLESAANALSSRLADSLTAITPSGNNHWTNTFFHPGTGITTSFVDLSVPANTLIIYAGGRSLSGSTLGVGGPGGFGFTGVSGTFADAVIERGQPGIDRDQPSTTWTDFAPWGGSITFDIDANWYFDSDVSTTESFSGTNDFYSVALHELGHVLGVGTADSWDNLINTNNNTFLGAVSTNLFGGLVPVQPGGGHLADGTTDAAYVNGTLTPQEVAMDPSITVGTRKYFTELDFAVLNDTGWEVVAVPEPREIALASGLALVAFAAYRRRFTRQS